MCKTRSERTFSFSDRKIDKQIRIKENAGCLESLLSRFFVCPACSGKHASGGNPLQSGNSGIVIHFLFQKPFREIPVILPVSLISDDL